MAGCLRRAFNSDRKGCRIMGKLFYIMGKSATGKDTIYEYVLAQSELALKPLVMYTTRPIRANETDGVQYHFVTEEEYHAMDAESRVIEMRMYHTVHGPWYYFTADGSAIDLDRYNYLALGTLESFQKVRAYYGEERVLPIYIEVEDGNRLERALKRERKQNHPNFSEVCRRYLADEEDFSEEKIRQAGILRRFANNAGREDCMEEVTAYIRQALALDGVS